MCTGSAELRAGHDSLRQPSIVKRATRTRLVFALLTSSLFLISLVFLILVEIGNVNAHQRRHSVQSSVYFIKLDLSHIIPRSVPNSILINSIARTLGLHDFYQVGLWNFCEGYGNTVDACSKPRTMYWFNPVEILLSELLAGATIALPSNIIDALALVRKASRWMFALFLTGASLTVPSILLAPLSIYTRWASLPLTVLAFLAALTITVATIVASAMFVIFKEAIHSAADTVNIGVELGAKMFAFMWIASGAAILGWLIQFGGCCCCASRRDVKTGRRKGSKKAYAGRATGAVDGGAGAGHEREKPKIRKRWMSNRE
ncbi:MAG: hypothetical protein LQ341_000263 [Variospora aurantia]|nr:MAG: hypothetical protein LQ341_000263 [Variospora aurantia]